MADYHPLIARAVAGLEKNTGEHRRALYERARTALVAQLRGVQPALDESEITRERLALEEAIRKVEAESARQAREQARPTFVKRVEIPRREEPPRREELPPRREELPPRRQEEYRREEQRPEELLRPSTPPPRLPVTNEPAAPLTARSNRRTLQDEALRGFRDVASHHHVAPEPRRDRVSHGAPEHGLPPAPSIPAPERHPLEEYGQLEPQMQPENLWALPLEGTQAEGATPYEGPQEHAAHPPAREEIELLPHRRPPRSYGKFIRMGLVVVLIAFVGGLAYWQSSNIVGLASSVVALFRSSNTQPTRQTTTPVRPKITDRIGQPSTQPQSGPPVAQRVVLYEEDPDDPQGKRYTGTVLWRTEVKPAASGRPADIGIRADIDIPDRKMTVTWTLSRNSDQSLPASHTIEIVFNLPADSPSGGVQNVPGVLMKQAEQTRGVPLAGLAVKVTPGYFLIGLSSLETDVQRNIQLLKERSWFDIPIVYNNNRRAILAMEKGPPGERAFAEAFAAWKR